MKVPLKKLSICECGFPVLHDAIPLGTMYEVVELITNKCLFICGGCGKQIQVTGVFVMGRGESKAGFLPRQIFFPESETSTKN